LLKALQKIFIRLISRWPVKQELQKKYIPQHKNEKGETIRGGYLQNNISHLLQVSFP